ncbi:uncharacterized protein LOC132279301 [Cornus florida]|uniref:uncharacterized protein LOC132279301 n=1 Tax=Cornus florida TaxID=4283 RepID=UPI00289C7331|nr:uncharacterized protein LOC132279301 [Cornus florida]
MAGLGRLKKRKLSAINSSSCVDTSMSMTIGSDVPTSILTPSLVPTPTPTSFNAPNISPTPSLVPTPIPTSTNDPIPPSPTPHTFPMPTSTDIPSLSSTSTHIPTTTPSPTSNAATDISGSVTSTSKTKRCKTTGVALATSLAKKGPKPVVIFRKGQHRLVGGWAKNFGTEVGLICRTRAPITCGTWLHVDEATNDVLYRALMFDVRIEGTDLTEF